MKYLREIIVTEYNGRAMDEHILFLKKESSQSQ